MMQSERTVNLLRIAQLRDDLLAHEHEIDRLRKELETRGEGQDLSPARARLHDRVARRDYDQHQLAILIAEMTRAA
jgi:hypothetical protein